MNSLIYCFSRPLVLGVALALLPAIQSTAAESGQEELLWRAVRQVEIRYPAPKQAGLAVKPEHILFLEKTQGRILRTRAVAALRKQGQLIGRIEYAWTKAAMPAEPALVATFTATMSENGIVGEVRFGESNFTAWEAEIAREWDEYRKKNAVLHAVAAARAALEGRGFSQVSAASVVSWEGDIFWEWGGEEWSGFSRYAYSPDAARAKFGLAAYKPDKYHYFTIELSGYGRDAGKWAGAVIIAEEIWEGRRPLGKKISATAPMESLW